MFASSFFEGSENECNKFCPNTGESLKKEVFQLKWNRIPKGFVSLECLFDRNDKYVKEYVSQTANTSGEY